MQEKDYMSCTCTSIYYITRLSLGGDLGEKSLLKLAHFSLLWAEGDVNMYGTLWGNRKFGPKLLPGIRKCSPSESSRLSPASPSFSNLPIIYGCGKKRKNSPSKVNTKKMYSVLKHSNKTHGVAPLKSDGRTLSDDCEKSHALNRQFQSVFSPKSPERLSSLAHWKLQELNDQGCNLPFQPSPYRSL